MSSSIRATSNVAQGNAFFINVAALAATDLLTANGTAATFNGSANIVTAGGSVGGVVLRDMGKTVRIPATNATGLYQRVLRKVQFVDPGALTPLVNGVPANGFVNYNEGVGGALDSGLTGFQSFFIEISAVPSGAVSVPKFARLSV